MEKNEGRGKCWRKVCLQPRPRVEMRLRRCCCCMLACERDAKPDNTSRKGEVGSMTVTFVYSDPF